MIAVKSSCCAAMDLNGTVYDPRHPHWDNHVHKDLKLHLLGGSAPVFLEAINLASSDIDKHFPQKNGLSKKDQARITNAADKQFTSLGDFLKHGEEYFSREITYSNLIN